MTSLGIEIIVQLICCISECDHHLEAWSAPKWLSVTPAMQPGRSTSISFIL